MKLLAPAPGWTAQADVIVVGSGIAGLTTALQARTYGLSVLIVTKSKVDEGVEYFKNSFSQRSKKSKTPNNIVKNEIKALEKVIEFDSIVYKEPFHFDLEDFIVDSSRIKKIHKFILNLKRGIRLNTDYISIPTIVISNKWSNYNIVIAESIWFPHY